MQTSTQSDRPENLNQPVSYAFFLFASFAVWLIATLLMRFWGQNLFIVDSYVSMGGSFLFSLLCLPAFVYGLFRWQNVHPAQRREAAICLAIPGMLLDVVTTYFFDQVLPNISVTANGAFGAWLLWGYGLVLITGLITGQKSQLPGLGNDS